MFLQIRKRLVPVADGQKTDSEIPDEPCNRYSGYEAGQTNLEHSRGYNENFEGSRRRQQGREQHPPKTVVDHPIVDRLRPVARMLVKQRLPTLFGNVKQRSEERRV